MFIEEPEVLNMIAIHLDRNLKVEMFCLHIKLFPFRKGVFAGAQQQVLLIFFE